MTSAIAHEELPGGGLLWRLTSPDGRVVLSACPDDGGGVSSVRVGGRELLHRANQFSEPEPGQWMGRAPLLWPAVGRNFTEAALRSPEPACGFEHDGRVWDLPIHGFARHKPWRPTDSGADAHGAWCRFTLTDDDTTRAVYPWPFRLAVTHRVDDAGWSSTVTVSSGAELPFGIGNHLTVTLPRAEFDQVLVAGGVTCVHELTPHSLLSGVVTPVDLSAGRPLSDPLLHNAVLGGIHGEPWLTVTWPSGRRLRVSQQIGQGTDLVRPEDVHFVLYANPELHYFCPEPWLGRPNGLQTGEGLIRLPAGRHFEWTMRVDVEG